MRKWTEEEIKVLRGNYKDLCVNDLQKILKDRSKKSIEYKLHQLKLKKNESYTEDNEEKLCKKCKRILPNNKTYFPVDNSCKTGLRNVCRECNGRKFLIEENNYQKRKRWNDEENEKFKLIYPIYTNEFLIENYYPNLTRKQLNDKAWRMGLKKIEQVKFETRKLQGVKIGKIFKGVPKTEEQKRKQSETKKRLFKEGKLISCWKGRIVTEEEKDKIRKRTKGKWAGNNNPIHISPLFREKNGRWLGGITDISQALRETIVEWKKDSMKKCNYKCVLSGEKFDNIHHLYPFNLIIKETFSDLNLKIQKSLSCYDE
ncbi:hypothetical protein [Clostridium perfringens]|uniref:HNH endonuclease n=1 Tax=Clostridium perfringens TaxID=1502 RepID=A0AAW4IZI5_CLOPF|nr:hypothetical protein [Clostridium perfringens]MBO3356264.1 hypothetical protein [Clostridium perfringens]MBO3359395.1 hypothetical protein [Clostridium perfringens]